jgi:hypothetical protein
LRKKAPAPGKKGSILSKKATILSKKGSKSGKKDANLSKKAGNPKFRDTILYRQAKAALVKTRLPGFGGYGTVFTG